MKMDAEIKKKWTMFIIINIAILIICYGALSIGLGIFSTRASETLAKSDLMNYANILSTYSIEELKSACQSDSFSSNETLLDPNFYFAIYTRRSDGSFSMLTRSDFLANKAPAIGGKLSEVTKEKIGNHEFLTYTFAHNLSNTDYVKVFSAADWTTQLNSFVGSKAPYFALGYIIISIILSFLFAHIEIRPIMKNFIKQKGFINDMSHEIRTPLAIIKGNLENIQADANAKVSDVNESIEECLEEVDYMSNMSTGLLRIVKGSSKNGKANAKFSEVLFSIVDTYAELATLSNKSMLANIETCDMTVDKDKIKELMSILIENALKYTEDGDKITIKLKNTDYGCVLSVSDTGIGVPKEELDKIFERLYRAENAKAIQGTGLGLTIAKSIVESMNGNIKAVRNIPKGLEIIATFKKE